MPAARRCCVRRPATPYGSDARAPHAAMLMRADVFDVDVAAAPCVAAGVQRACRARLRYVRVRQRVARLLRAYEVRNATRTHCRAATSTPRSGTHDVLRQPPLVRDSRCRCRLCVGAAARSRSINTVSEMFDASAPRRRKMRAPVRAPLAGGATRAAPRRCRARVRPRASRVSFTPRLPALPNHRRRRRTITRRASWYGCPACCRPSHAMSRRQVCVVVQR